MNTPAYIPQIRLYQDWLARTRGLHFDDYDQLWRWSTTELEAFWASIWEYFDIQSHTPYEKVLAENVMPGAHWFTGAQVNFAQQVLRHVDAAAAAGLPAIIADNEEGVASTLSWPELHQQVAALAVHLQELGVQPGDRVAAYLPNIPQTIVAFLATASIGAVWSVCAPDMGTHAVLDRFRQIEPVVLIGVDGVFYGGKAIDRQDVCQQILAALPSVRHAIVVGNRDPEVSWPGWQRFADLLRRDSASVQAFEPRWLPFEHPLWIVYSSGTTGLPKPIVHGHGGMMLVQLQLGTLHNDIGCSYAANSLGERYHWYSSTGWVMWNAQVGGLLAGTTIVIFDGNPAGARDRPDMSTLWRFAARHRVTFFGVGAAFYALCAKADIDPAQCGDLRRIRVLGSTGSPLSEDVQNWGTAFMRRAGVAGKDGQGIWWSNISGGTDFAGAFLGGNRELPQTPGRMQCRMLGAAVQAWDETGQAVADQVGELVCTQPIPSMPLYLWGDADGSRYRSSYFDTYAPGHGRHPHGGDLPPSAGAVWRHGDWLSIGGDGSCVIYGRSDATINRHGLRMGTSEVYSAVEALPEVLDALVVDLEYLGRASHMPLFVVLREGVVLDAALRQRIDDAIRVALSPRFVPDAIVQVAQVPRTLSGKKQELPIKKLLLGQPVEKIINRDTMANPDCLDWYVDFAQRHLSNVPAASQA
ncbi:acetoacetate--CoA ligase [Corticibacter populi]|uniref:Acetoacetate--CoA ligase n=1 Tax=Corticibacter populi TaxID=1550736 RepID=A0A3M6QP61_9BURK|nr:acetoacetate--CoA ligase [Corticibacter populi]RMX04795.1 acetoacetate--CoA ligase [Corticibacter populi]RZS33793.1 acetoacetyl-CoA synthetase [Corticibacter populi]